MVKKDVSGGVESSTVKPKKRGELFREKLTDMGDFTVRRLAPGVYETVIKSETPAAS